MSEKGAETNIFQRKKIFLSITLLILKEKLKQGGLYQISILKKKPVFLTMWGIGVVSLGRTLWYQQVFLEDNLAVCLHGP